MVRYPTSAVAAPLCFEYFETPSCQPPTVPTEWPPVACGRTVTLNFPSTGVPLLAEYAYGQLRMKAALPASKAFRASSSWYEVTPRGVMLPTQPRTVFRIEIAFALLIVTLPLSMMLPPPLEAIHSRASQVRPS